MTSRFSRRQLLGRSGRSLIGLSLASLLYDVGLATDQGMESIEQWFDDFYALGKQLAAAPDDQTAWQDGMDKLYGRVSIEQLSKHIDMERLTSKMKSQIPDRDGELFHNILIDDQPTEKVGREPAHKLITKIAYVKKGRAIPPHGHSNMVSAFLNLSGQFQVRLFDKLESDAETMTVRPALDKTCGAGAWSSISDDRHNVHWITAASDDCFLFTTKMIQLVDGRPFYGRINIDVRGAQDLGDGALRAERISHQRAAEIY